VLGRVAPGDSKAVLAGSGLPPAIIEKFYADKGKLDGWAEDDRLKFMGAMISIGTTLAVPSYATQQEWTQAKNAYTSLNDRIAGQLGSDIWDKVDAWYQLETPDLKDAYVRTNPEVGQAMDAKAAAIANDPLLAAYYNGLNNITLYWEGEKRKDVMAKLGADYYDILRERAAILDPKLVKRFDAQHPQLKKYAKINTQWIATIERKLLEYRLNLPEKQASGIQNVPMTSTGQQEIVTALQQKPVVEWQTIQPIAPTMLQNALYKYFTAQRPLTSSEKSALNRTAAFMGITADDIMVAASKAIQAP
jgi:hypothetical protein